MKVRFILITIIFLVLLSSCNSNNENTIDAEKYRVELNNYANEYMMGLKSVLVKNMQQGGPLKAINVCSDTAAVMTNLFSEKKQVRIKRASLKNRNKNNYPDSFEVKAILHFTDLINNEKSVEKISLIEKMKIAENDVVVYTKPIFIEAPCLNCHGSEEQISLDVAEFLKNKYPDDKATGYKIGDLRGVISVTKIL